MASLHFNNHRRAKPSFMSSVGNKVKQVAEIAGAMKGIYDVGRMAYHALRTVGPAVATVGALL